MRILALRAFASSNENEFIYNLNDQVERRAAATPAQKEAMNRHVRSNAGLGGTALQVTRGKTRMLRNTRKHFWPNFFAIMKGEHKIG